MWHDMDPYDLLNKLYSFYMVVVVIIVSGHGLSIDVYRRNQHYILLGLGSVV